MSSDAIGFASVGGGAAFFVASTFALKKYRMGLVYQVFLYLLAMFLPSIAIVAYYNHKDPATAFQFSELFTNSTRALIGAINIVYFICVYTAFKILPFSLAFPLLYFYPAMYVILSAAINKTPVHKDDILTLTVITLGLLFMCWAAEKESSTTAGTVLMITAALCSALYFVFIKSSPSRKVLARSARQIIQEDYGREKVGVAAIQMVESTAMPLIVYTIAVAICLAKPRWLQKSIRAHPAILGAEDSTGWTAGKLFLLYLLLSFGENAGSILANDFLPPDLFTSTEYLAYVGIGTLVGIQFLGESFPKLKAAGFLLVVLGASASIALHYTRTKPQDGDASCPPCAAS